MSRHGTASQQTRRAVLRDGLRGGLLLTGLLGAGGLAAACSSSGSPAPGAVPGGGSAPAGSAPAGTPAASTSAPLPTPNGSTVAPSTAPRTLLAYFSRPGENYYRGGRRDLDVGNTEVVARQIAGLISCDTDRIKAAEAYSESYDNTVARNAREENADARPEIADQLPNIDQYDDILIGSPIWNVRTPMIMMTFAEALDLTGKTVHPFVTFAVSGLGRAQQNYDAACRGATVRPGLAVQGEEAADHEDDVRDWLRQGRLLG